MSAPSRHRIPAALLAGALVCASLAPEGGASPRPLNPDGGQTPPPAAITNPPLKQIDSTVFEMGLVRLDRSTRTLRFPGVVNMRQGPVEYLLVHETGKIHESVLKTAAEPYHIHLAALLLQPKAGVVNTNTGLAARDIQGPALQVRVRHAEAGITREVSGEDLVFNTEIRGPMPRAAWTYNGSRVLSGTFLAQRDGSIASVITDPDALLNSMRDGRDRDDIWEANTNTVPAVNTPVEILLQFQDDTK